MADQDKPDPLAAILEHERRAKAAAKEAKRIAGRAIDPHSVQFTIQNRMMQCMGFDPSMINKWISDPTFPGGRTGPWDLAAVWTWYRSKREKPEESDMDGPPSPALERYREARAKMVEMELAERKGNLLPREKWRAFMNHVCGVLRQAGEILLRQHGPQAHAVLDDAIAGIEREKDGFFGDGGTDESE